MAFDDPRWLLAAALALLPWWRLGQRRLPWPSLAALPADVGSLVASMALRTAASAALVAAAFSLAGAHRSGEPVERTGTGAHIVVLLDRSASMADGFANPPAGTSAESKGHAAARLLEAFVEEREQDLFGLVFFSTAPMHVLDLTSDHDAVRAAISTSRTRGAGLTNISAGLTMALEQFSGKPRTGSRVLLLVSDGAAGIDQRAQVRIRHLFQQEGVQLYWVFLRSAGGDSPTQVPDPAAATEAPPEHLLHVYFSDLGMPYRLYEADNPSALAGAIADVGRLQNMPLRYLEAQPRQELSPWFDVVALAGALLWAVVRGLEVQRW